MEKHGQGDVTMEEIEATKKQSAWTEEEREQPSAPIPMPAVEAPEWAESFPVGALFQQGGWWCRVLGYAQAQKQWFVAIMPERMTSKERKRRAREG